jgi:hypothetical protein
MPRQARESSGGWSTRWLPSTWWHPGREADNCLCHQPVPTATPRGVSELTSSRCPLVLVDQSAEDLATTHLRKGRRTRWVTTHRRDGRAQAETAMRAVLVVVLDVAVQNANKVLAAEDQEVVQALSPDGPNPTLGDGVGVGRPNRRADDLGTGRTPDIVERSGELGVPVADQEPERAARSSSSTKRLRACWATHRPVGWAVTPAKCTRRLRSSMTNSTYGRRSLTVSTVKKSQARMPVACRRRNDRQVVGARRGAGSMPWARSTLRIELAEIWQPRRSSSPRIRW